MTAIKRIFSKQAAFFFIAPALLWQVLFLYAPFVILLFSSFFVVNPVTHTFQFTFEHYRSVFDQFSLKIFFNSFFLALQTTAICLLVGYAVAYYLAFKVKGNRIFYLFLLILPSWTSLIIQVYAWFFLLKKGGVISQFLYTVGLTAQPIHLLNSHFSMLVGMVYCYMPFMALPIYAVLDQIDRQLLEASADLGASRWVTIKKIILPLSVSGIIAGTFLVFIPAFGEFAIPEFLGGSKKLFWGNIIVAKFLDYGDWPAGAAVVCSGVLLPLIAVALLYGISRIVKRVMVRRREIRPQSSTPPPEKFF